MKDDTIVEYEPNQNTRLVIDKNDTNLIILSYLSKKYFEVVDNKDNNEEIDEKTEDSEEKKQINNTDNTKQINTINNSNIILLPLIIDNTNTDDEDEDSESDNEEEESESKSNSNNVNNKILYAPKTRFINTNQRKVSFLDL